MQQCICNPELYGDLVYKFKKIIGDPDFSNLLKRIVNRFKRAGQSLDIIRQTACLVFNPIIVEGYAALFNCTAVVQASNSMQLRCEARNSWLKPDDCLWLDPPRLN